MRNAVKGYTLTDLAILVGILGIMTSFAYPRYAALKSETKKALVRSLGNNVHVSAQVTHLLWITEDEPATIVMDNRNIDMVNGYPDQASIDDALANFSGFQFENAVTARFTKIDAPVPNACMVSYADAALGASPSIDVLVSGC